MLRFFHLLNSNVRSVYGILASNTFSFGGNPALITVFDVLVKSLLDKYSF